MSILRVFCEEPGEYELSSQRQNPGRGLEREFGGFVGLEKPQKMELRNGARH